MSTTLHEFYVPRGDSVRRSRWTRTPMREATSGLRATLYNEVRADGTGYSRLCLQDDDAPLRAQNLAKLTGGDYDEKLHPSSGYVEYRVTWQHEAV